MKKVDFIEPKHKIIKPKKYLKKLLKKGIQKDLYDNEEVCKNCKGTGIVLSEQVYGLSRQPDRTKGYFPYTHQYISFCPKCYNGVVRRCKLCGEIMDRGHLKHNCQQQKIQDLKEEYKAKEQAFEKAPLLPTEKWKDYTYFYSEYYPCNNGYFTDFDEFFEEWIEPEIGNRPQYAWVTEEVEMSLNAQDIVENACEELYEDAISSISNKSIEELQEFLDQWTSKCGVSTTYYPSHEYKVRIPWEDYEGECCGTDTNINLLKQ